MYPAILCQAAWTGFCDGQYTCWHWKFDGPTCKERQIVHEKRFWCHTKGSPEPLSHTQTKRETSRKNPFQSPIRDPTTTIPRKSGGPTVRRQDTPMDSPKGHQLEHLPPLLWQWPLFLFLLFLRLRVLLILLLMILLLFLFLLLRLLFLLRLLLLLSVGYRFANMVSSCLTLAEVGDGNSLWLRRSELYGLSGLSPA